MSKFPENMFPIVSPSAGGTFQVLGAVPFGMNSALVYFELAPLADDPEGFDSATNPANWAFSPVDPSTPSASDPNRLFVPDGEAVPTYVPEIGLIEMDLDDPRQALLRFNTPLETNVRYDISPTGLRTTDCDTLVVATVQAKGLFRPDPPAPRFVQEQIYRDFDFRFFPIDRQAAPATFRYDSTGDIGIQDANESLRKRLLRRMNTAPGAFTHLGKGYGTDLGVKKLARSGNMTALVNICREQALLEPDVREAGCEARLTTTRGGSLIEVVVRVTRKDASTSSFVIPISPQE
jgi:hypothetical protein